MLLHHFADAGDFADIERSEELRFFARNDVEDAVGLGLRRRDFGNQAGGPHPDGTVQAGVSFHAQVQGVRGFQRRAVQAFGTGHVEIGFVDGGHFHLRRKCSENFVDFFGALAVTVGMSVDEDGLGAEFGGGAQRHGGMDSEFAGRVGGG